MAFGEHLVKTGEIHQKFYQYLRDGFERRQESDYEPIIEVDRAAAQETLDHSIDFVDACRQFVTEVME